ncbi:MAG: alpha-galactosidase [Propionibacteriaceae bacterium]|nr:alpha-galactosidase [Propionibacteriaceae bacterium]
MGQQNWVIQLRVDTTAVLIHVGDSGVPAVLHWGSDWGAMSGEQLADVPVQLARMDVDNVPDIPLEAGVLPAAWTGWPGQPGVLGHRGDGTAWSPRLSTQRVTCDGRDLTPGLHSLGAATLIFELVDEHAGLAAEIDLSLEPGGTVQLRGRLRNLGGTYHLLGLNLGLPVPLSANEIFDFTGRWGKERVPQRRQVTAGVHLREHRRGRPGFDATTVMLCGAQGFDFRHGQVWGLHVASAGNSRSFLERVPGGQQILGGGALLHPGEVMLKTGEQYQSPSLHFTHGQGLDEAACGFHRWVRSQAAAPGPNRPVALNVWEAVGFDHGIDKLKRLADLAASVGVERYIVDDGWFLGRRDDTVGLGDWVEDPVVWPDGLTPIVEHVRRLGMQFGLWFEPEMVSPNSELARQHPEWILAAGPTWPVPWRNQQVLNLTIDAAKELVFERMDAIVRRYRLDYIKWDHNRDSFDAGHQGQGGRSVASAQVAAALEIMDRLRAAHPYLEIESCSSGGARIDLEMARHVQRFWVSDCIDPLERQAMQRWTMQLIPPELLGTHIASGRNQSTSRQHDLAFRAATAIWGHLGIEWDLTKATDQELRELAGWVAWYKQHRQLLLTGSMIRDEVGDGSMWLHGVLAADGSQALFSLTAVDFAVNELQDRLRLPGLDPAVRYHVRPLTPGAKPAGLIPPPWFAEGAIATGAFLGEVGLTPPALHPEQALLLEASAVSTGP